MNHGGLLICFVGVDGSGKTTQSKLLVDWLASQGIQSIYVWSRGEVQTIRRLLLILGRRALRTSEREIRNSEKSREEYQSSKSRLLQNPLVRSLWSTTARAEHLLQINREVRRLIREGYIVVCDRYLWDSTIDLAILNNKKPDWLVNKMNLLLWSLVPKPAATFFIDTPPEEALRRKEDIPSLEYVERRANMYQYLAKRQPMVAVNGEDDPASIFAFVTEFLREHIELQRENHGQTRGHRD